MDRTYLFVAPEEYPDVEALGAQWDSETKCWYVDGQPPLSLARWSSISDDEEYSIISNDACVASTKIPCPHCGQETEIICIHCLSGTALEQSLKQFTVFDVRKMDEALLQELKRWPSFRRATKGNAPGDFSNHCAACGEVIGDAELHSEPDQVFFDVAHATEGAVAFVPIKGTVRLSGSEHFVID